MVNKLAQSLAYLSWKGLTDEQKRARTAKAREARALKRKAKK